MVSEILASDAGPVGALEAFVAALGPESVTDSPEALGEFRDPYPPDHWDHNRPGAMVTPRSVEEVQAVVRIANEHRVPLWTFSQGRNNGYGGAAPVVKGSVLVNLREMNRVLEINEESAYALVEPGVSFLDLYEAIQAGGHKLWVSVPDLGWGSVIGNTLDHGIGYTVDGDHPGRQCGMEVVLADGEVVRTGMGAMADNRAWQTHKRGFGPTYDGMFMQSNFGIVTKMGVWLMPEPESYAACNIFAPRFDDLPALVEILRGLMLDRTISVHPIIATAFYYAVVEEGHKPEEWWSGKGPMPEEALERMARDTGIGRWGMRFALYGSEALVDANLEIVREQFEEIEGSSLRVRRFAGSEVVAETKTQTERAMAGIPTLELLDMIREMQGDNYGHLDFSITAPATGKDAVQLVNLLRPVFERYGIVYDPSFLMSARSLVMVTMIFFSRDDEDEVQCARSLYRDLVLEARAAGYGPYRTHVDFMDLVAEQYDFGDHALMKFSERIKHAVDPNGILSPGKQGIWPEGMRPDKTDPIAES
jgi:4-cresol dehydrogenase (hydroxylating)